MPCPLKVALHSISAEEARSIRDAVLRSSMPAGGSIYPGDDAEDTLHIGAFVDNRLCAVATICRESRSGTSEEREWRLRGMAALEEFRGIGLGKELAERCSAHAIRC
jgi:GNAT superfamily N-acetyltransferase